MSALREGYADKNLKATIFLQSDTVFVYDHQWQVSFDMVIQYITGASSSLATNSCWFADII